VAEAIRITLHLAAGAVGSGIAAAQACRLRTLTRSGAWAAALCGTVLYAAGGWTWIGLVAAFFATSSALTRLEVGPPEQRRRSVDYMGRRWDQVAANGGIATLTAAIHGLTGSPLAFPVAAGAIAAATADTWATEVGRWSRVPPRLITTGAAVPPGTSGGVTVVGTLGALGGAVLIGGLAAFLGGGDSRVAHLAPAVVAAGFSAALIDSVLGATIEGRWRWVGNSTVNLTATAWGAGAALLVAAWWR